MIWGSYVDDFISTGPQMPRIRQLAPSGMEHKSMIYHLRFAESTVGVATALPVCVVSEEAVPGVLECAELEVSAGPELP